MWTTRLRLTTAVRHQVSSKRLRVTAMALHGDTHVHCTTDDAGNSSSATQLDYG